MPNWVNNEVLIERNKDIEIILNKYRGTDIGMMETLVGKTNNDDWYQGNIDFWGTKWDVAFSQVSWEINESFIKLLFNTAWSPPIPFLERLYIKYFVKYEIYYFDEMYCFSGAMYYYGYDSFGEFFVEGEYIELSKLYDELTLIKRRRKIAGLLEKMKGK
jgi:hypothetical protein